MFYVVLNINDFRPLDVSEPVHRQSKETSSDSIRVSVPTGLVFAEEPTMVRMGLGSRLMTVIKRRGTGSRCDAGLQSKRVGFYLRLNEQKPKKNL